MSKLFFAIFFSLVSFYINADTKNLDEIIVTAQSRESSSQEVPISITAIDGNTLTEYSLTKIEDIAALIPNFTYTETGSSTTFFIRGIGSGINQAFEQSVGLYVDGINLPRAQQARAPFLDVEQVEALRGPQTTFFGKNAVAGAISVTTAKPTDSLTGKLSLSHELENDETTAEGAISGQIMDGLRGRLSFLKRDSDGFQFNTTLNRNEPSRDETIVRIQFESDLSDSLTANLKYERNDFDEIGRNIEVENALPATSGDFAGLNFGEILVNVFGQDISVLDQTVDGNRHSNGDFSFNTSELTQLSLKWDLNDFSLNSTTSFQDLEYRVNCDCDFTGAVILEAGLQQRYDQFTQEFRLSSPTGGEFDYILGVYYGSSNQFINDQIILPNNSILGPVINAQVLGFGDLVVDTQAARTSGGESKTLSTFAQFNWRLSEDLKLQLGGRLTKEDRTGFRSINIEQVGGEALSPLQALAPLVYANLFEISSTNLSLLGPAGTASIGILGEPSVDGDRSVTNFSPDIKLIWSISDDDLLYLGWGRGFKSGGFDYSGNNRGSAATSAESFEFDDEVVTNIEFGGKFAIGDDAELNATLYFTDVDDLQISIFDGALGFNVGNAARAEVKGIEVDGRWAFSDNWQLNGNLAYTDFEFKDFQNGQCYAGQTPDFPNGLCDYTGLSNNLVADVNGNLTLAYSDTFASEKYRFSSSLNLFYTSEYGTAATQDPAGIQESFSRLNVRLAVGSVNENWEIAIFGENLTDEVVRTFNGDVPLAFSTFGAKTNYTFYSQGRALHLQSRYNF